MNNKKISAMKCEKCGNTKLFYREESYEGNTSFIVNGNCEEVEDGGYNCNNTTKYKCY